MGKNGNNGNSSGKNKNGKNGKKGRGGAIALDSSDSRYDPEDSGSAADAMELATKAHEGSVGFRRVVAIVGNTVGVLALLAAIAGVGAMLWITANGTSMSRIFEDDVAGTRTISAPTLLALLALVGLIFGQFASRGMWGIGLSKGPSLNGRGGGTFAVQLRPISVPLHLLFIVLAVVVWLLVLPVPVVLDRGGEIPALPGSSALEQFWFTVTVYGALSGAVVAMITVSLLKKLSYNRSLERNREAIVPNSPEQRFWRKFSHIWRAELLVAALGGAALGLSPLGIPLDSPAYGFGMLGAGLVLFVASIPLALNAWRSGLPVERVESYT